MPRRSRNEHLVPAADLPFYQSATVVGLRQQLQDNGLDSDGLKYDLYLRLINAGHRLYTDDRPDGDADDGDADDGQHDGQQDDDQQDDDQQDNGHGGNPRPKGGGKRPRGSGRDSPSNDGGSPRPPPRRRRRLELPPEVLVTIIRNLHPAALWNLIDTAPEAYLDAVRPGGLNVLLIEARSQYALDYPPPPPPVPSPSANPTNDGDNNDDGAPQTPPDSGPSSGDHSSHDTSSHNTGSHDTGSRDTDSRDTASRDTGSNDHNPDDDQPDDQDPYGQLDDPDEVTRTISLLEWVGMRATYDSRFRTANRTRINRVIDAYLTVYGLNDPAPEDMNPRQDLLYFFRDRTDIQFPGAGNYANTPLTLAAMDREPVSVQLILTRGANVNQSIGNWRPLDRALARLHLSINSADGIQVIFTLIGAGANLGLLRQTTQRAAFDLIMEFDFFDDDQFDLLNPPDVWPRIDNPLGLTIRQFIADERSRYWDRVLLSMYVIWAGVIDYPLFV